LASIEQLAGAYWRLHHGHFFQWIWETHGQLILGTVIHPVTTYIVVGMMEVVMVAVAMVVVGNGAVMMIGIAPPHP